MTCKIQQGQGKAIRHERHGRLGALLTLPSSWADLQHADGILMQSSDILYICTTGAR